MKILKWRSTPPLRTLEIVSLNPKVGYLIKLFEVSDIAVVDEKENSIARIVKTSCCVVVSLEVTLTNMLMVLKAHMKMLSLNYSLKEEVHPSFIESRSARAICGGKAVGIVGEIHPEVLVSFDINVLIVAMELSLNFCKLIV